MPRAMVTEGSGFPHGTMNLLWDSNVNGLTMHQWLCLWTAVAGTPGGMCQCKDKARDREQVTSSWQQVRSFMNARAGVPRGEQKGHCKALHMALFGNALWRKTESEKIWHASASRDEH